MVQTMDPVMYVIIRIRLFFEVFFYHRICTLGIRAVSRFKKRLQNWELTVFGGTPERKMSRIEEQLKLLVSTMYKLGAKFS